MKEVKSFQSTGVSSLPAQRSLTDEIFGKVLVIYTGGTIGMVRNHQNVLAPARGRLVEFIKKDPQTHDPNFISVNDSHAGMLVLPYIANLRRVVYEILEYEELMDSSNMDMNEWTKIAIDIKKYYDLYDGFVILHGTDTLAYTSSALSFMLENLGKPVIVTGSQIPILSPVTDGKDNFICSVAIAGCFAIPEVTVFFNHELYRGNRVIKMSADNFNAFHSYNYPPLGRVGITFEVYYRNILNAYDILEFTYQPILKNSVALLKIYPGITASSLQSMFQPPMEGVVLQTYGAGNIPVKEQGGLLELFKSAVNSGIILVNVTQCKTGSVCSSYLPGKCFYDIGVLPGNDMTPEAAFTKLCYVISKREWSLEEKKKKMLLCLRGEMSDLTRNSFEEHDLIVAVSQQLKLTSEEQKSHLSRILIPSLVSDAIANGNLTKLMELKKMGVDFNLSNLDLRTPLHFACTYGNVEIVKFLLKNGANIHVKDRFGNVPLLVAVNHSTDEVIQLIVSNGGRLNMDEIELGTELCRAAARGQVEKIKKYCLARANLNSMEMDKRTPLHMACLHQQIDVVRFLIHKGVSRNKIDNFGKRPIDYARLACSEEIVKLLS